MLLLLPAKSQIRVLIPSSGLDVCTAWVVTTRIVFVEAHSVFISWCIVA